MQVILMGLKCPNRFFIGFVMGLLMAAGQAVMAQQLQQVVVVKAESDTLKPRLQLTATVESPQHARLASQQSGLVAELFVEIGDSVITGQKLLALDDGLARLRVAEAKASLAAAEIGRSEAGRLYQEVVALSKKKFVAKTLIAERLAAQSKAEAELARQRAAVAIAEEELSRYTLYAPFMGMVASRAVNLGEWVSPQTPVFTLVQQRPLRLSVEVPQENLKQLAGEVRVRVKPDLQDAQAFDSHVQRLVPVSSRQSRAFTAHIALPESTSLAVGMSAKVEIFLNNSASSQLWLPRSALKQHPDGGYSVFALEGNKTKRYIVKLVDSDAEHVAISGAPQGLSYIAAGVELMGDGEVVTAVPYKTKQQGKAQ